MSHNLVSCDQKVVCFCYGFALFAVDLLWIEQKALHFVLDYCHLVH